MPVTRRRAIRGGIAIAATVPAGCLGGDDATGAGRSGADRRIETISAPGSPGSEVALIADTPLTLLYFFATWCAPCRPQNEALADVDERFDGIAMRGISPEPERELVREYWIDAPAEFPVAIDEDQRIHEEYDVLGYPSLVLLDRDGEVRWDHRGLADVETIAGAIDDHRT